MAHLFTVFNKLPDEEEIEEIPDVTPVPDETDVDIANVEEEIARLQKELEESEEFEKQTVRKIFPKGGEKFLM